MTGTYSLEKIDNSSSKLGLTFENLEEPVTGVYGTRVYSDDSESAQLHYKLMKISCLLLEKIHK